MSVWTSACAATLLILTSSLTMAQSLSTGMVAWWRFDGSLLDEGPNAHHGVATGTQVPSYGDGVHGLATRFDGVDDRVRFPMLPNSAFGSGFSIAFWLQMDDARSSSILGKRSACNLSHGFDLVTSESAPPAPMFVVTVPGQMVIATGAPLPASGWAHIVAVRNGNTATVYVDGNAGMPMTIGPLDLSSGGVAQVVEIRKRRSLQLGTNQDTAPASAEETTPCATLPPLHRLCRN